MKKTDNKTKTIITSKKDLPPVSKKQKTKSSSQKKITTTKKKSNKIFLTIILTAIIVVALMNISKIITLVNKSSNNKASSTTVESEQSDLIINNSTSNPTEKNPLNSNENIQQKNPIVTETQEKIIKDPNKSDSNATKNANSDAISIAVYFVKISNNDKISIIAKSRTVSKSPAILTLTLTELLKGPNPEEISDGVSHFIPNNTLLNKISVENGVAKLDFNEAFQLNEYGSAGILAQLYQIVFTCTEISNINSVQITINNQTVKYLGGEGTIEVDVPLTRKYLDSI